MTEIAHPPVALLLGVTETRTDHAPCSLVFTLETQPGQTFTLTLSQVMAALRFAQRQAIMLPLSGDWWARTGLEDGSTL